MKRFISETEENPRYDVGTDMGPGEGSRQEKTDERKGPNEGR